MKTVILVAGAWHGGWCWKKMVGPLTAAGCRVYTPSLTGLGDRRHLLTREVSLQTHVDDLLELLAFEDARDVVLLAHSYGAAPATVVADRVPERIAHLILLDGTQPEDGQCVLDVLGEADGLPELFRGIAREQGDGWRVSPAAFTADLLGVTDPADAEWLMARLTDHPLPTFEDRVSLTGAAARIPRRTYVRTQFPPVWPDVLLERARSSDGWTGMTLPTGHDAMVTMPGELVDLVLS
ncbi:alpha/beta fold hydrolase [Baekduia soli]|nr:alpha/beta hydrolase [Baekduia soli]